MKKVIMIMIAVLAMTNFVKSQDTIITKIDNKTETVICKITKITSMNAFYTEKGIGKNVALKDVVYHSNFKPIINKETIAMTAKALPLPITAGDELIKSSNHFYVGVGFIVAGFIPVLLDKTMPFMIFGGVLSLTGIVFTVESHIHLKRAGILLNKNGIGVSIPIGGKN